MSDELRPREEMGQILKTLASLTSAATTAIGTSGAVLGLLNTANTISAIWKFVWAAGATSVALTKFGSTDANRGIQIGIGASGNGYLAGYRTTQDDTAANLEIGTASTTNAIFISVPITPSFTVATLPAGTAGGRAMVTDATLGVAAGLGLAPIGGGANIVPVYYDTAWKIG